MEIVLALLAGAFIGAVLGFVGAGGAMLSVPILMYIFDFAPKEATTAALAIVSLAALSGAIPKMRTHKVLYRDAFTIWAIGLVANVGLSLYVDQLPDTFITTGFATVLTLAAYSMLKPPRMDTHKRVPLITLIIISLVIGSMTGLFGIGGGFLAIPILVLFFGTPQSIAAGTSLVIISLNSMTALLARHTLWHLVSWHLPLYIAGSAVVVAQLSSHASHRADPANLRKGFAYLLFAIALFTIAKTWLLN